MNRADSGQVGHRRLIDADRVLHAVADCRVDHTNVLHDERGPRDDSFKLVLRSQRGVKGGYSFGRPPHEVTVLEVVELLDGPLGREATSVFAEAAAAARAVLASTTVADVIDREARDAGAAMYYI